MCVNRNPKVEFSTVTEKDLHRSLSGGSVFGWGRNTYDPESGVITLRFLFSDRDAQYHKLPMEVWLFSTVHTHEIAHHILSSSTRVGITLRQICALLDGLVLLIAKKMLRQTGKLWIPLKKYLDQETSDPALSRWVRAVYSLEFLRHKLIENWHITNELFALCVSAGLGVWKLSLLDALELSEEEAAWILSIVSDESTVDRVIEKLSVAVGRRPLFEMSEVPGPVEWEELVKVAENIFSGAERTEAIAVLRTAQFLIGRYFKDSDRRPDTDIDMKSAFRAFIREVTTSFEKGKKEYQIAHALFQRFDHTPENIAKMAVVIGIVSNLYAPIVCPSKLIQPKECIAEVQGIDQVLGSALEQLMDKPIGEMLGNIKQVSNEICSIQEMLGSVALGSLNNIHAGHVLASPEWFEELYKELHLNHKQKSTLKGLVAGSQIESEELLSVLSVYGGKIIPKVMKPLFHLFWACKGWARNRFPPAAKVYEELESTGLTNFRALENAVSLYYPFVASFVSLDVSHWHLPSISVCYDPKGAIVIMLGAKKEGLGVRYAAMRSVLSALRNVLFNPLEERPVVLCTLGVAGASPSFCSKHGVTCTMRRLAPLFMRGSLFVCCKKNPAKFLRLEDQLGCLREAGRVDLVVRKCEEIWKDKMDGRGADKHGQKKSRRNRHRDRATQPGHPIARAVGTIIGRVLACIITAPITLWLKGIKWRQYKVEWRIKRSLSQIHSLLKKTGCLTAQRKA